MLDVIALLATYSINHGISKINLTLQKHFHVGVDIEVIQQGKGPAPTPGQKVSVHYTLTLEDGKKIDSSYDREAMFEFTVGRGQVISGWDEGIQNVLLGSKVKATISPVSWMVVQFMI